MKKENKSFKIYAVGNPLIDKDSLPIRLLPHLKNIFKDISFAELDPSETFPKEEHLILIDSVLNLKEIKILKDIDKIEIQSSCSLHDFDLGFNLKLMKKMGWIKHASVICLPVSIDENEALNKLKEVIPNLLLESE